MQIGYLQAENRKQQELIATYKSSEATHRDEVEMMRKELGVLERTLQAEQSATRGLQHELERERERGQRALALTSDSAPSTGALQAEIRAMQAEINALRTQNAQLDKEMGQVTKRWNEDLDKLYQAEQQLRSQARSGGAHSTTSRSQSSPSRSSSTGGVEETLRAQEAIRMSRAQSLSLSDDQLRDALAQANIVMDQMHGHLSTLRNELAAQRAETEQVRHSSDKDRALLGQRTAELMMTALINDIVAEKDNRNLIDAVQRGQQPTLAEAANAARRLAQLEARNVQLSREVSDLTHRLEFTTTARDLLKKEVTDLQDHAFRNNESPTRDKIDEVRYLKQKLEQMEERTERDKQRLEKDKRDVEEMRRSLAHQKTGEAWEQLMRVKDELEVILSK